MQKVHKCLAALALLAAAQPALAHDLLPPAWRGLPGSTFQEWSFPGNVNPAPATTATHGTPSADISVSISGSGWFHQLPTMGTPTGYWDLGGNGSIVFDVNAGPDPLAFAEISVQVTYYDDLTGPPDIDIPGATLVSGSEQTVLYESTAPFGEWMLRRTTWSIAPNPGALQVMLMADAFGALIDHVIIDTYVVPEPATMLALGAGCALLLRRRTA